MCGGELVREDTRLMIGILRLITDVRLCNEMCYAVVCQKGAVMSFSMKHN